MDSPPCPASSSRSVEHTNASNPPRTSAEVRGMPLDSRRFAVFLRCIWALAFLASPAAAAGWTVTVTAHQIEALTNSDNWGGQDIYWRVRMKQHNGPGHVECSTEDDHPDDDSRINPGWGCTGTFSATPDPIVDIRIQVFDEDTVGDDELDLSIDPAQLGLALVFRPRTGQLTIVGDPSWPPSSCAFGRFRRSGFGGGGDEPADIELTVSASPANALDGDSDGDGLPDTWETCGVAGDTDHDLKVDDVAVDLPAMGADPFRKDVFAEIDWMVDSTGPTPHTHGPWLPALVNAWNELNLAPVTNPTTPDGITKPSGIMLHVDVGTLYSNYTFDIEGDGTNEFTVGATGNVDLNADGIPDIGNLGVLGSGKRVEGQALPHDSQLDPPSSVTGMPTAAQIFADGSDFSNIAKIYFSHWRDAAFHYVVFGHSYRQVQGGPANSSGVAQPCAPKCNRLIVSLGAFRRQTRDTDRNNLPDGLVVIPGPGGLPVDGLIRDHTGTFLHELGHNFKLGHGGGDELQWKPNYLSIMNYYWQTTGLSFDYDGDRLGDAVGMALDGDVIPDVRRFQYSNSNPDLNEKFLDETKPLLPGGRALTAFTCPTKLTPPGPPFPRVETRRVDEQIDWSCETPGQTNVPSDVNNVAFSSGVLENLPGFDDFTFLANDGLRFDAGAGIGKEQRDLLEGSTQRILEPSGREEFMLRCRDLVQLHFDDQPRGTVITTQYGPLVTFTSDATRQPTIAGPGERNGVPTASPHQSLLNRSLNGKGAPLEIIFKTPQRVISLRMGQAGLVRQVSERSRVVLEAFDHNNLSMGKLMKQLPPASVGITELITAAAIFPDQLITRIELRYELAAANDPNTARLSPEPVQIDDLAYCGIVDNGNVGPVLQTQPTFGELTVELTVRSEGLFKKAGLGEPGNTVTERVSFNGVPVVADGTSQSTSFLVQRKEGSVVKLKAPLTSRVGPFLYWRYGDSISLGKSNLVDITLLRNGTLTAVYRGDREPPHEQTPPPRNGACGCFVVGGQGGSFGGVGWIITATAFAWRKRSRGRRTPAS